MSAWSCRLVKMVNFTKTIADGTALWGQMARIGLESQMVIGLRVAGMMGFLPHHPDENRRMVHEKFDAMQDSSEAAMRAIVRGASADKVMSEALKPIGKRTRANAKRLGRRHLR